MTKVLPLAVVALALTFAGVASAGHVWQRQRTPVVGSQTGTAYVATPKLLASAISITQEPPTSSR